MSKPKTLLEQDPGDHFWAAREDLTACRNLARANGVPPFALLSEVLRLIEIVARPRVTPEGVLSISPVSNPAKILAPAPGDKRLTALAKEHLRRQSWTPPII